MALARIISRSHRAAQSLAMDLLSRGYAVEIVSPEASPASRADLVVRVEPDRVDQANGAVPGQDHWIDFDAEQTPADVAAPGAESWWPSETIAPAREGSAELNDSARLISPPATEPPSKRDVAVRNTAITSEDRSGTWLLRASIGFAAIAVLVMFGLALAGGRAASRNQTSTVREPAGVPAQTSNLTSAETLADLPVDAAEAVKTSAVQQKTAKAATPRRPARSRDEEGIIAPDTFTHFDRRKETRAAPPSPAIKHYSDLD